ncbi:MAG: glycosyltransferase family 2 protein [Candidatus Aenigmarchaeota archaeon]|nr:glycosyltransferase family 2 protein [Candidatus Aenigmarchaeota archaeon]
MPAASVIIPVYNEMKDIESVLKKIRKDYEVIVVDDGSDMDICGFLGKKADKCIRLEKNTGKGYACRVGAEHASCEKIVFIDGDSQLDPYQIPQFVSALDKADMVVGFRSRSDVPFQRMISNTFAAVMVFLSTRRFYRDVLCGFRAFRKSKFLEMGLRSNRYEFETETMIKASRRGLSVIQVPVSVEYKRRGMGIKESVRVVIYQIKELIRSYV